MKYDFLIYDSEPVAYRTEYGLRVKSNTLTPVPQDEFDLFFDGHEYCVCDAGWVKLVYEEIRSGGPFEDFVNGLESLED